MIGRSAASRASSSPIEGVIVLGMHRSGTSVVTRLISLLGLALCHPDDLLAGFPGNPRGHWESKSLVSFDAKLLGELDGTWFCPPALEPPEIAVRLAPHRARGLSLLHRAHPRRPFVWKDPRACLLLPFWASVLERRVVHVIVARHPMEVAESLEHRNGFSTAHGLALWERYSRLALLGSAERPTALCTYDEVLAEPLGWSLRFAAFLRDLGVEVPDVDEQAISAFVAGELRRGRRSWGQLGEPDMFPAQRVTLALATAQAGTHYAYEPPKLGEEAPATEVALAELRRRSAGLRPAEARFAARIRRPAPDEDPRPPSSLVIARDPSPHADSAAALAGALPAGSEVFAAEAGPDRQAYSDAGLLWRELAPPAQPIGAWQPESSAMLAAALGAATGRTVLISTAPLPSERSWFPRLHASLTRSKAGCVAAAVVQTDDPYGEICCGAFADRDLQPVLVAVGKARGLLPAPLVLGGLCALDRRVLSAAGGLDPEFDTLPAALAELSLRLQRMGFASFVLGGLELPTPPRELEGGATLYDRMRIGALHLSATTLQDFYERARRHADYDDVRARLQESDLGSRRALTDAVCAFSAARYFEEFPPHPRTIASRAHRARTLTERSLRRLGLTVAANGPRDVLELAGGELRARLKGSPPPS